MKNLQFITIIIFLCSYLACQSNNNKSVIKKDSTTVKIKQQQEDSLDAEDLKELAPVVGGVAK
jgi:hypothetical protein